MSCLHSGEEVVKVILQADFLLGDVELLNVENHLLLKAVLVVVNALKLIERLLNASLDFRHALCLVAIDLAKKCLNIGNLIGEKRLQAGSLLSAELNECLHCFLHSLNDCLQFRFIYVGAVDVGLDCIGHSQQRCIPIHRQRNVQFLRHSLNLRLILLEKRQIKIHGTCIVDRLGVNI